MDEGYITNLEKLLDIKDAGALLLKGGSLISEQCNKCKGVQIKFRENIICINCGNEQNITQEEVLPDVSDNHNENASIDMAEPTIKGLEPSLYIFEKKVSILSEEIRREQDIATQKLKAELIEIYLRIIEKIKGLMAQSK
jgi:uncharacterized Zn finger protein (UPF0148 family)